MSKQKNVQADPTGIGQEHSNNDFRSELNQWIDLWNDSEDAHPVPEVPKPVEPVDDFSDVPRDHFYDYMDMADELLQEMKSPNPVYPDSVGPDHQTTDPVWVSEELVKEIEGLRSKLFDVENRLAKQMGGGEKWVEKAHDPNNKSLVSEIESLRKRIEKVSSQLGVEKEPSPWEVKRD